MEASSSRDRARRDADESSEEERADPSLEESNCGEDRSISSDAQDQLQDPPVSEGGEEDATARLGTEHEIEPGGEEQQSGKGESNVLVQTTLSPREQPLQV